MVPTLRKTRRSRLGFIALSAALLAGASFTSQIASAGSGSGFHKFEHEFTQSGAWEAEFGISYLTGKPSDCKVALRAERRMDGEWKTVVAGHGHRVYFNFLGGPYKGDPKERIGCSARLRRGDIPGAWPKLRRARCNGERIRLFMQASVYKYEGPLVHHESHTRWMKKLPRNPTLSERTYSKYKGRQRYWCGRATVVEDE